MNLDSLLLSRVSVEDKAKVFDALVREFQNKGRFVGHYRVLMPTKNPRAVTPQSTPPTKADVDFKYKEVPMYDFVLRVNGHDDFFSAILHLAGVDSV